MMSKENQFAEKCMTLQKMKLEFIRLVDEKEDIILNQKNQDLLKITDKKLNDLKKQIEDLQKEIDEIGWVVKN